MNLPVLVLFATTAVEPRRYDGHALLEVNVPDAAALAHLLAIGVEPWTEHLRPGPVSVLVAPDRRAAIEASAWAVRVVSEDVQPAIDAERERLAGRVPVQRGGDPFADYLRYDDVNVVLDDLAAEAPDIAATIELGDSIEGRPIRGIRIGDGDGDKPALIILAGQHAREWISISTALWIATQFVEGGADTGVALDAIDIVVVPIVNPDGYEYSWDVDRNWRKNRRDGIGVDTNRNFSWNWGPPGGSTEPTSDTYAGSGPFSEPETVAVRDYVEAHDEIVALVDLHAYSQLVMWPWCSVYEVPPDGPELEALGQEMADAMFAVHDVAYTPMQGIDLYLRSGNAIDWAYGDQQLFSFTIELRPTASDPAGYSLPPEQIVPVGEEALAGILAVASWSAEQGMDETTGGADTGGTGSSDSGDDTTTTTTTTGSSTTEVGTTSTGPIPMTTTTGDDSSSSGDVGANGEETGCSCRSDGRSNVATAALALVLGLRRRRRTDR